MLVLVEVNALSSVHGGDAAAVIAVIGYG